MDQIDKATAIRLIAFVCAAQVLVQIGAFFWPALVPEMMARWRLTNSEAGWITAAFYGAYMLAVPVLVTLTDRVDTRRVYLGGVAAMIAGHALFAALADGFWSALRGAQPDRHRLGRNLHDRPQAARRQGGRENPVARRGRPRREHRHLGRALLCVRRPARAGGRLALRLRCGGLQRRGRVAHHCARGAAPGRAEPNRRRARRCSTSARCCAIAPPWPTRVAYGLHTLEMAALRGWGVAFLASVAASTGAAGGFLSPTATLTALALHRHAGEPRRQ